MNPPPSSPGDSGHRRYFKYNFSSLLDSLDDPVAPDQHTNNPDLPSYPLRSKRKSPTIEFRQQRGTLDPDVMKHWIRFLGALVDFAGEISLETLTEFLGIERRSYGSGYEVIEERSVSSTFPLNESRRITPSPSSSPRIRSAANLTGARPIGSMSRLFTAMESANVLLDPETYRFWRRKFPA
jgi:hypothetical protein